MGEERRVSFHPLHYLRVASHFWPWERAFWLALFHDSVEDGWMSLDLLDRIGLTRFADELAVLTRQGDRTYAEYIDTVLHMNVDCIRVKRADLAENYARAPASLRKRYAKAMDKLA